MCSTPWTTMGTTRLCWGRVRNRKHWLKTRKKGGESWSWAFDNCVVYRCENYMAIRSCSNAFDWCVVFSCEIYNANQQVFRILNFKYRWCFSAKQGLMWRVFSINSMQFMASIYQPIFYLRIQLVWDSIKVPLNVHIYRLKMVFVFITDSSQRRIK